MGIQADGARPDHDVVLTDDNGLQVGLKVVNGSGSHDPTAIVASSVERSSLKTSSGNQSYSDLEPPYTVLAQSDWSGGRGSQTYEDDVTRFYDSCRVNTGRPFSIILNGRETYGTGVRSANTHLPGSMRMLALAGDQERLAVRFAADGSYTAAKIGLWVAAYGNPAGTLTVRLCADHASGTKPGTVLQTVTITYADLDTASLSEMFLFDPSNQALTNGVYYWIEVYATTSDVAAGTYWKVGVSDTASATYQSADDGTNWSLSAYSLYYRVMDTTSGVGGKFFTYKRAKYFVTYPTDGSASKIYKNGRHGACISNTGTLNKLKAGGSPGWTTNQFVGCVVLLLEGPGITEKQAWRVVTANDSNTLTVDTNWLIDHTTATSFVILGEAAWVELAWHSLTKPATGVVVTDADVMYIAQGEDAVIQQGREYNNAGTWTTQMGVTTVKGVHLETYYSGADQKIVRTNGDNTISEATAPAGYGGATTFGTAQDVGSPYEKITGLTRYVDATEAETIWVWKESGPWIWNGTEVTSNIREEMRAVGSEVMGRVSAKSDVYMFFSVMNTVWRFYDPTFDDIGPMLDGGLPANRSGVVSAIYAYPGRTLVAFDAGDSGYSTVMEYTGGRSWHEVYRAPKGERITAMDFQSIPGTSPDRMWIRQGADFVWIPFPSNAFDPKQDTLYPFTHEGMVQLASMYAGLIDAYKYWKKIKFQMRDLVADTCWVEADYRLDDGDWVTMPDVFEETPLQEQEFTVTDSESRRFGVSSRKIDLRVRLVTVDQYESPVVTAMVVNAVTVAEPKYTYTFGATVEDKDLNGKPDPTLTSDQKNALVALGVVDSVGEVGDTMDTTQKMELLRAWSGRAQSLWMNASVPLYDGRPVFLAPLPMRSLTVSEDEGKYTYSTTITLQEA
jgi:hypothetical protein